MKTYFIAGYSKLSKEETWHFYRVWEADDVAHPSSVFMCKVKELEASPDNFRDGHKGELVITAFNQV